MIFDRLQNIFWNIENSDNSAFNILVVIYGIVSQKRVEAIHSCLFDKRKYNNADLCWYDYN